jgi:predicted branched-subunit amino acid permease
MLLVLVAVMAGIVTAMATGILARADGASYPSAITRAGVAFAGTVTLAVLIINALHLF